jgi:hypothetical protein
MPRSVNPHDLARIKLDRSPAATTGNMNQGLDPSQGLHDSLERAMGYPLLCGRFRLCRSGDPTLGIPVKLDSEIGQESTDRVLELGQFAVVLSIRLDPRLPLMELDALTHAFDESASLLRDGPRVQRGIDRSSLGSCNLSMARVFA